MQGIAAILSVSCPSQCRARPFETSRWPRRSSLRGHRLASKCRWQAVRDRQLSSGLGRDDPSVLTSRAVRPHDHRRVAALLLGRRARQESDALLWRSSGRELTALTSDLGCGKFDGAWLVQNFENQNPANTLWTKQYNLYAKIDTEVRYIGFEKYWGGHVYLNAEEIQFIVDELFIGNKLAAGMIKNVDGTIVDLRNIRSPIVVFCSRGDNITPPQQALGWILDVYDDVEDIIKHGQTIVYTIHESIGHLGIFVSAAWRGSMENSPATLTSSMCCRRAFMRPVRGQDG